MISARGLSRHFDGRPAVEQVTFELPTGSLLTLLGPFIIDASATKISVADKFLPPVFMEGGRLPYFLGTDQLGRDLLLRSLVGLRNAFLIGVVSVVSWATTALTPVAAGANVISVSAFCSLQRPARRE